MHTLAHKLLLVGFACRRDDCVPCPQVRSSKQDQIHNSIVSTLLALMDGLDSRGSVVVIGQLLILPYSRFVSLCFISQAF